MKKLVVLVLAVLAGLASYFVFVEKKTAQKPENIPLAPIQKQQQQNTDKIIGLNGLELNQEAFVRPAAVVVENFPDSRPQSGLLEADLVYETLAEGGITRFLAIYQSGKPEKIGPVRSARTYFAEIANELGAVFAHVGGNSDVLELLKSNQYPNLIDADQFYLDHYFWRSKDRLMPHNVYTSAPRLEAFERDNKISQGPAEKNWNFKEQAAPAEGQVKKVQINFSLSDYFVSYTYDQKTNSYLRFLAKRAHLDAESKQQISPKVIVVQMVKIFPVKSDTPFSIGMDLESGGLAYVFQQGSAVEGVWKKNGGRTRFYDGSGKEITFNPGRIWVEIVPDDGEKRLVWE